MDLRYQNIESPDYDIRLSISGFVIPTVSKFKMIYYFICLNLIYEMVSYKHNLNSKQHKVNTLNLFPEGNIS